MAELIDLLLTLESACSSVQSGIYAYHLAAHHTPTPMSRLALLREGES